jgi:phosphatidylserine/phosphatidylglycerophosphate/cardiolipin synthase-like enzyme
MKTTNFGTMLMVENSPATVTPLPGQTFFPTLFDAVKNAKLSIDIIQYQWNFYRLQPNNPVQRLNQILLEKIRGGLKCRILLNKEGRTQHLMKINMEASKFLKEAGASVKFGRNFPITHAKMWLIDHDISIVGSHNLSGRALTVNNEVSALITSVAVNQEYDRYFDSIWTQL